MLSREDKINLYKYILSIGLKDNNIFDFQVNEKEFTYGDFYYNDHVFSHTSGLSDEQKKLKKYLEEHYKDKKYSDVLLDLMKKHGIEKDPDIYAHGKKEAREEYIHRGTFNKIINGKVIPNKETTYKIAILSRFSPQETDALLSMSNCSSLVDDFPVGVIVSFFLKEKKFKTYDNNELARIVNEALVENKQKPLFFC